MDILLNGLPDKIQVGSQICRINADYKTGLRLMYVFEDRELGAMEKNALLIKLLYIDVPENIQEAIMQGIKFLNAICVETNKNPSYEGERYYSFTNDGFYIFPAIDQVLNGKLSRCEFIHWWEFVMAFLNLPEDCQFSKILYYRIQYSKGKLSKEEKKIYNENRAIFELPSVLSEQEKQAASEFMRRLKK